MQYRVTLSDNGKYVHVVVTGDFSTAEAQIINAEAHKILKETQCKRLLFDVKHARNVANVQENYNFAYKDMENLALRRDIRVAILVSPGDQSHDFAMTAMQNAGYCIQVFNEETEAIAWFEG